MKTFGAMVEGSPSMSTRAGKDIVTRDPTHPGSLGTAISEAIELARTTPNCKYTLGSVLNHVALHQTIIGLEAESNGEAGEYPDRLLPALVVVVILVVLHSHLCATISLKGRKQSYCSRAK